MPLSNLTKFHLHFYAVMAVSIAFGLSVLAGPVFLIMQLEYNFLWLFPIWGIGQRAGSVCLNSLRSVVKWISALVMPQPGLAAAR